MSHSANVTIKLYTAEGCFEASHVGAGTIITRDLVTLLTPQEARLVICIDGVFEESRIWIAEPVLADRTLSYEEMEP